MVLEKSVHGLEGATMNDKKDFRQLIFEALIDLNEENKDNPRNVLIWLVDRSGHFYFYHEANSIFFWAEKNEKDFIKLGDSHDEFWDDNDKPKSPDDISDDIDYYLMLIHEHVSYDFPSRPFILTKTRPGKSVRQPNPSFVYTSGGNNETD